MVVRGFGEKPNLLLTNVAPSSTRGDYTKRIAEIYVTRWRCEEAFRYIKQSYRLEDVRVRSYVGLRNTVVLVHAVAYFVSVVIGTDARLRFLFRTICEKAQRFFGIARFYHYAVADGIHQVLFASAPPPHVLATPSGPIQRRFPFELPPPLPMGKGCRFLFWHGRRLSQGRNGTMPLLSFATRQCHSRESGNPGPRLLVDSRFRGNDGWQVLSDDILASGRCLSSSSSCS